MHLALCMRVYRILVDLLDEKCAAIYFWMRVWYMMYSKHWTKSVPSTRQYAHKHDYCIAGFKLNTLSCRMTSNWFIWERIWSHLVRVLQKLYLILRAMFLLLTFHIPTQNCNSNTSTESKYTDLISSTCLALRFLNLNYFMMSNS